ncbi:MAG: MBL fold metallo-hydrolase [Nevskia sp.]|nr:MBL fold metallo-hydrolase [Nevskia sp.]
MRIRFWGTRGSLPVALTAAELRQKVAGALVHAGGRRFETAAEAEAFAATLPFAEAQTFGGSTSCVELELNAPGKESHEYILCDLGSGVRSFGNRVLARHGRKTPNVFHIFMSHVHWDHIMGFPFFTPAYIPGNTLRIYGCHDGLEDAFRRQQAPPSFPVEFEYLGAQIEFIKLEPGRKYDIAGLRVTAKKQLHAGDSYGYRFESHGKVVVYSTDSEHKLDSAEETESFVRFFFGADLVIFDAMYSLADAVSVKEDWGHSSNMVGVELCQLAGARHLVLFHHEPVFKDAKIAEIETESRRLEALTRQDAPELTVSAAYDGLEIDI